MIVQRQVGIATLLKPRAAVEARAADAAPADVAADVAADAPTAADEHHAKRDRSNDDTHGLNEARHLVQPTRGIEEDGVEEDGVEEKDVRQAQQRGDVVQFSDDTDDDGWWDAVIDAERKVNAATSYKDDEDAGEGAGDDYDGDDGDEEEEDDKEVDFEDDEEDEDEVEDEDDDEDDDEEEDKGERPDQVLRWVDLITVGDAADGEDDADVGVTLSQERMAALLCNEAGGVEFGELIKDMRFTEENITKETQRQIYSEFVLKVLPSCRMFRPEGGGGAVNFWKVNEMGQLVAPKGLTLDDVAEEVIGVDDEVTSLKMVRSMKRRLSVKQNYVIWLAIGGQSFRYCGESTNLMKRIVEHVCQFSRRDAERAKQEAHAEVVKMLRQEGGLESMGLESDAPPKTVAAHLIRTGFLKVSSAPVIDAEICRDVAAKFESLFLKKTGNNVSKITLFHVLGAIGMVREAVETAAFGSRFGFGGPGALNRSAPGIYYKTDAALSFLKKPKAELTLLGSTIQLAVSKVVAESGGDDDDDDAEGGDVNRLIVDGEVSLNKFKALVSSIHDSRNDWTADEQDILEKFEVRQKISFRVDEDGKLVKKNYTTGMKTTIERLLEVVGDGNWSFQWKGTVSKDMKCVERGQVRFRSSISKRWALALTLTSDDTVMKAYGVEGEGVYAGMVQFNSHTGMTSTKTFLTQLAARDDVKRALERHTLVRQKTHAVSTEKRLQRDSNKDLQAMGAFGMTCTPRERALNGSFESFVEFMIYDGVVQSATMTKVETGFTYNIEVAESTRENYTKTLNTCARQAEENSRYAKFLVEWSNGTTSEFMAIRQKADATTYIVHTKNLLALKTGPLSAAIWKNYVPAGGWNAAVKLRVQGTRLLRPRNSKPSFNGLLYKLRASKILLSTKRVGASAETETITFA